MNQLLVVLTKNSGATIIGIVNEEDVFVGFAIENLPTPTYDCSLVTEENC